jgi:hypothetical protein
MTQRHRIQGFLFVAAGLTMAALALLDGSGILG